MLQHVIFSMQNGEYITVYSGHIVFQWSDATTPEFYCIDLGIKSEHEK